MLYCLQTDYSRVLVWSNLTGKGKARNGNEASRDKFNTRLSAV